MPVYSCILLYQVLFSDGFLAFSTMFTRRMYTILLVIYLSTTLGQLTDEIIRVIGIYQNDDYSLIFIGVYLCFLLRIVINILDFHGLYIPITDNVQNMLPQQLKLQIAGLLTLLELSVNDTTQDVYFKGIIQKHISLNCQHPLLSGVGKCFCKKKVVFDSKKGKDATLEKWISNKTIFAKFLIKSWLETNLINQPNTAKTKIFYAEFLFNKFRNHQISLECIEGVERHFLFLMDRYRVFLLRMRVLKWVDVKNKESYRNKLEIEKALFVEEKVEAIKQSIKQVMTQNCKFWNLLQKNNISLLEINQLLHGQFNDVENIKTLWMSINYYLDYKKKWKFYYAFFTLYILNKKVQNRIMENFAGVNVNENDIFSEEVQENNLEDEVVSVQSAIQIEDAIQNIDIKNKKIIFDKKSAILHTNDDNNAQIVRINKQFTKIFGYTQEQVVNKKYIQELMPSVYAKRHPYILEEFKLTGKSNVLYSQKKIYCLHAKGQIYCFTAWKFVKLFVTSSAESQFVALIRPTDYNNEKKQDFMLVNGEWELDGLSQNLMQLFKLDPEIFFKMEQRLKINLLLLAPKLIIYTKMSRLLKEEDLNVLGILQRRKVQLKTTISNNLPQINVVANEQNSPVEISYDNQNQLLNTLQNGKSQMLDKLPSMSDDKFSMTDIKQEMKGGPRLSESDMKRTAHKQIQKLLAEQNSNLELENFGVINEEESSDSDISQEQDFMVTDLTKVKKNRNIYHYQEDRLENGDPINFLVRIPDNLFQTCSVYIRMKQAIYAVKADEDQKRQAQREEKQKSKSKRIDYQKQSTLQQELRKKARMLLSKAARKQMDEEEQKIYQLLLNICERFLMHRRLRRFKATCTVRFKRVQTERVGILKVQQLQELVKVRRRGGIQKQSSNNDAGFRQQSKQGSKIVDGSTLMLPTGIAKFLEVNNQQLNINLQSPQTKSINDITPYDDPQLSVIQSPYDTNGQLMRMNSGKKKITLPRKQGGMGYQLPNEQSLIVDPEEGEDQPGASLIDWTQFQHQFKMQSGTQNISLNPMDNIFRKEDNNKPIKFLTKIKYLAWFLRLMFLSIVTINLFTYFWGPYTQFGYLERQSTRIQALTQLSTNVLQIYDNSLNLLIYTQNNTNYTQLMLQGNPVGDKVKLLNYVFSRINSSYQYIKQSFTQLETQKTFLDDALFPDSNIIDPVFGNLNVSFDQQDQLQKFVFATHEIAHLPSTNFDYTNNSYIEFVRFCTIQKNLHWDLKSALILLLQEMSQNVQTVNQFLLIVLILESCIFIIAFFGLLRIILWICETFKTVLEIFSNISRTDLEKISMQQKFIQTSYEYLLKKDDELITCVQRPVQLDIQNKEIKRKNSNVSKKSNIIIQQQFQNMQNFLMNEDETEQNINFVKKNKVIEQRNFLNPLTLRLSIAYLVFILITASASIAFHLTVISAVKNVQVAIDDGTVVVNQFTDAVVLLILVKERYLNETNYNNVFLPRILDIQSIIQTMQQTPSITPMNEGTFASNFEQTYFGNICTFLNNVNAYKMDESHIRECDQLSLQKLTDGIVTYNQYFISQIQDLVLSDTTYRFGNIDSMDLWSYSLSIQYITQAYSILLQVWTQDTTSILNNDLTTLTILISTLLFLQFCVFIYVGENYLINQLNKTFSFYRRVYKSYMPNDIVQKVKIIRAKLVIYGIIKK